MPRILSAECRHRFAAARHAYLATTGRDLRPHVVPVVFALAGDRVVVAVDDKPKRTTNLRRLRNILENREVSFLVDDYDEDWDRLWWVRADACARIVEAGPERDAALERLAQRYVQYRRARPSGPVIVADVERWRGWVASAPGE